MDTRLQRRLSIELAFSASDFRDANALFPAHSGQWAFHFVRGDQEIMRQLAKMRDADHANDEALLLAGYRVSAAQDQRWC
jgi:predicted ATPase